MVLEIFLYGFISAFGWWTANLYVIEPRFPPVIEKKKEDKKSESSANEQTKEQIGK